MGKVVIILCLCVLVQIMWAAAANRKVNKCSCVECRTLCVKRKPKRKPCQCNDCNVRCPVDIDQLRDMLVATTDKLQADNDELRKELQAVKAQQQDQLRRGNLRSAFSAHMTIGFFRPVSNTFVIVPLNGVDFDLNGDYNNQTSIYTCPVAGVYYFVYSVYSGSNSGTRDRTLAALYVDSRSINQAFCSTGLDEEAACQATNAATVRCDRNKKVWLYTRGTTTQIVGQSPEFKRTTMTGFLLYPN